MLGTADDLKALPRTSADSGIRLMFDLVPRELFPVGPLVRGRHRSVLLVGRALRARLAPSMGRHEALEKSPRNFGKNKHLNAAIRLTMPPDPSPALSSRKDPTANFGFEDDRIEADFAPKHVDTFRRDLHPDLRADRVLATPPFNESDTALRGACVASFTGKTNWNDLKR